MTRTIVFLMMLMSVLPSDGSAQAVPSSGDRIRIKQVDGSVLTGRLAATLSVSGGPKLHRSGGRKRHTRRSCSFGCEAPSGSSMS